ncbi:MAG: type IV secretion system DNA-binding domain-containing protein, partial [Candidatus Nomurabacteria bacterium]|nr:type IV secretion system DNA-binding domain-containing protein [Candidatus Nomurabacteria bacterium]
MSDKEPIKEKVTYIGKVDFRSKQLTFGIKEKDRTRHTYVIGKTGMGKSALLENLAIQDINNGEGVCFIDPHGSTAEKLLDHIPESRVKDVIYFAPFDSDHPLGLNVLEQVAPDKRHLVANGLMAAFKKLFQDQFSARMEYILNNIILALLENENQTLLGVNRMLTDKEYRKFIVSNVTDPTVRDFWVNEYANYTDRFAAEAAPAIQNKVGQFVANPLIRNIIGQQKTSFDLREIMDSKKILIVNLSKGKVGESNANLIGSLLITKIYLAAMSRADVGPYELEKLPPFYFYVDEFQNFANESFASILSEARKYNLALTVAHQYVEQMTDEVKAAVFGNVGTMIAFRVGAADAEIFEKEFAPYFILDDIVNLSAFQIYLRLMIDGVGSKPFSAHTLPPITQPANSFAQAVIASSRLRYSKPVAKVEEEVAEFYKPKEKVIEPKKEYIPKDDSKYVKVREIKKDTPLPQNHNVNARENNKEHYR